MIVTAIIGLIFGVAILGVRGKQRYDQCKALAVAQRAHARLMRQSQRPAENQAVDLEASARYYRCFPDKPGWQDRQLAAEDCEARSKTWRDIASDAEFSAQFSEMLARKYETAALIPWYSPW
jgi:hypothetical protein